MALLLSAPLPFPTFIPSSKTTPITNYLINNNYNKIISVSNFTLIKKNKLLLKISTATAAASYRGRFSTTEEEEEVEDDDDDERFEEAVELFNNREYYKCHDILEALWNKSQEPTTTLFHAILQCAVGFHHLFNMNHKGAMMELGEGLCKLGKMKFESGPFHRFEKEISAVLNFIYHTQLEFAACNDDLCITMDQSERSYQLLGGYGGGQPIYHLVFDQLDNNFYVVFCSDKFLANAEQHHHRIKLPILQASQHHLFSIRP